MQRPSEASSIEPGQVGVQGVGSTSARLPGGGAKEGWEAQSPETPDSSSGNSSSRRGGAMHRGDSKHQQQGTRGGDLGEVGGLEQRAKEEEVAVVENGKVRNGIIMFGEGSAALQLPGKKGAGGGGVHTSEAIGVKVSATAPAALSPCPDPQQQPCAELSPVAAQEQEACATSHSGSHSTSSSAAAVPLADSTHPDPIIPCVAGRGTVRSEPCSHASSPPRASQPLSQPQGSSDGMPHQSPRVSAPGCSGQESVAQRSRLRGPGNGKAEESNSERQGGCGENPQHSAGEHASSSSIGVGGEGDARPCAAPEGTTTASTSNGGSSSSSNSRGLTRRHSGPGEDSTSRGGGAHRRGGEQGSSSDAGGSSTGGRGSSNTGACGQGFNNAPAPPLPRGRGSRGSSGNLSSSGASGGGKHGGGGGSFGHQQGQPFSPRWSSSGSGGQGRLSVDEALLVQQSQQQLGNGLHPQLDAGGHVSALCVSV